MKLGSLEKQGWCETGISDSKRLVEKLVAIGKELGNPVKSRKSIDVAQRLAPTKSEDSYPNSLSAIYSKGEFPLHVDTAHWLTPCRYLILGCYRTGKISR